MLLISGRQIQEIYFLLFNGMLVNLRSIDIKLDKKNIDQLSTKQTRFIKLVNSLFDFTFKNFA
jgi:hypothetical protein